MLRRSDAHRKGAQRESSASVLRRNVRGELSPLRRPSDGMCDAHADTRTALRSQAWYLFENYGALCFRLRDARRMPCATALPRPDLERSPSVQTDRPNRSSDLSGRPDWRTRRYGGRGRRRRRGGHLRRTRHLLDHLVGVVLAGSSLAIPDVGLVGTVADGCLHR